jgi:hypothetical protein
MEGEKGGGGLILTNNSLSSMPIYTMSMFLLHEATHVQMDMVRSKFFWRGGDIEKFKYHMVKWENVCLPKDFGGLGIINTRLLNEALILKWAWRLQNLEDNDICGHLLKTKYFPNKPFAVSKPANGSQFWVGVQNVRWKLKWGANSFLGGCVVGAGSPETRISEAPQPLQ